MKNLLTTTAIILAMSTAATASNEKACTKGNASFCKGEQGATGPQGEQGDRGQRGRRGRAGQDGTNGTNGTNGANGADGVNGLDGSTGATGPRGADGKDGVDGKGGSNGQDGKDAVAPLGSLSFAAASASFYGDGVGFGLSNSNYGSLEGSIVFGFDLDNDWRVVVGITTDFNDRHAVSVGVGVSF